MTNFIAYNPVKLVFGRGGIARIAEEIPAGTRVLMVYGGGSIKRNGVYEQVLKALGACAVTEFGGIEPNPRYETCMKAAEVCRKEKIQFLLAVGGGSVLDGTKFIAVAAKYGRSDPWNVMEGRAPIEKALPLGCVMTLPATGSEMNAFAVISRDSTNEKQAFCSPHVFPKFSILDPQTTFSLPRKQTANGIVDTFAHVMEQYMCDVDSAPLTERMAESVLRTIIEDGPKVLSRPKDYQSRASLMWCATVGLNGWLGLGAAAQDWATHMIGHELTAIYGFDHARTLAIVMPAVHRFMLKRKQSRMAQYGRRIWGLKGTDKAVAVKAVEKTEAFFRQLGFKTKLSENGIEWPGAGVQVAARLSSRGCRIGEAGDIGENEVLSIFELAR